MGCPNGSQRRIILKHCNFPGTLLLFLIAASAGYGANRIPNYGKLPLSFEANRGQTDGRVKFLAHGQGYTLFLTKGEAVLSAPQCTALRMKFRGANPAAEIIGVDEQAGKSNYFVGNDPMRWHSNVPTYAKVRYESLYQGIDLVYYGNQRQLEYDFVVAPGADPHRIGFDIRGASKISRSEDGDLVLWMGETEIRWRKPVVYQESGLGRREIAGRYVIQGKHRVGFELAQYDRRRMLFIDPVLSYSLFLGGSGDDGGQGIATDSSGAAYVTGYTGSNNFPTQGPLPGVSGGGFVAKINPEGTALVYSTYLGGGSTGYAIAVDSSGAAYIAGTTGNDFPTKNPFQPAFGGDLDAFVAKLAPSGSALIYSSYLGGSNRDKAFGIAVDNMGAAYVTGYTTSPDFLTKSPFQPALAGPSNAFVAKITPSGSALSYSTYLGGNGSNQDNGYIGDQGYAIAVDGAGNAYVTGWTSSTNFPTMVPFQPVNNAFDNTAFVSKLNPSGSALVYSTYLGGSGEDQGNAIAVDAAGNAYVTGSTTSTDFPTLNPLQPALGGFLNVFITKINPSGSALVYSTFLGGGGPDSSNGIALDSTGDAYVTGGTFSTDFPTVNALQSRPLGNHTGFLSELNAAGSALIFSSYLGGSHTDLPSAIAVDGSSNIYVTGTTDSPDFIGASAGSLPYGGGFDAFVTKIAPTGTTTLQLSETEWTFAPNFVNTLTPQATIYVTNVGNVPAIFPANPLVGPDYSGLKSTTCGPLPLEPGAFCEIQFQYHVAAVGPQQVALSLLSNAANSPNVIQIKEIGYGVHVSNTSWNFSPHPIGTTSGLGKIYLTNKSPVPLNLSSASGAVSLAGLDPEDFSLTNSCSAAVVPYTTCELTFTFTPTAIGYRQASISILLLNVTGESSFLEYQIPIGGEGEP